MAAWLLAAAAAAAIQLDTDPQGKRYFRVIGGADGAISVYAGSGELAMLGEQSRSGADLLFVPRFALQPGLTYRVQFTAREKLTAEFEIEPPSVRPASIDRVYPTTDQLPENQLKLYLHFATPMARGEIYRHLQLLDAAGRAIEQPFLELQEELWDARLQRFTLLFDPGRVKRDLVPNREVGAPLQVGRSYTLVISSQLRDAASQPLRAEHRKRFTVRAADREALDPRQWRIEPPRSKGRGALTAEFPEPLDHALLQRAITVQDTAGEVIDGAVSIDRNEQRWQFVPAIAWQAGEYRLVIDSALEDLAGNRIGRLFDEDMSRTQLPSQPARSLAFRIGE